jgi:hypothetical protein
MDSDCAKGLTIACSQTSSGLELTPILLSLGKDLILQPSASNNGIAAIKTGQSLTYTPFCKKPNKVATIFEDEKANGLCKSMGFPCGIEARRTQRLNISSTFDNLG